MAPLVLNKIPIVKDLLKWFQGDDLTIDNPLFKLHHQASTFVIMFGLLFIFLENYLNGKAIICQGGDEYTKSYCWIHGSAYVREHLQGEATGCFVDQSKITSEADAPVTAYYLWIPFLLTVCFGFAKFPRSLWKKYFENGMIKNIVGDQSDFSKICQNFFDFRPRFSKYHIYFGFCEFLNLLMVLLSMYITDALLLNKFFNYGKEVLDYIWSERSGIARMDGSNQTHDPMCELFPTEVACSIHIGASTGAMNRANYLCILNNNIFNQRYFLVLWLWWVFLLFVSVLGLLFRLARIFNPDLSRTILSRKVNSWRLDHLSLSSSDSFVLHLLAENLTHFLMDKVLMDIAKIAKRPFKTDLIEMDNGNGNNKVLRDIDKIAKRPFKTDLMEMENGNLN